MSNCPQNILLGWLDLNEEDTRRAKECLAQFGVSDTLDELGFGILRDAFADIFYPATSTIMSRTRYLVFIPALCLAVEKEKLTGRAAEKRLTDLENQLRESLFENDPDGGVIGRRAKESLKRYPSSIYWSALRRLGIFQNPHWGLAYYQDHLTDIYAAMTPEKDNDGLLHLQSEARRNWDKELSAILAEVKPFVTDGKKVRASLDFMLTLKEARYLSDRYKLLAQREGRPSMISHLIDKKHSAEFSYPWDTDTPCPSELEAYVRHARCLSMLAQGATLQYFHILQHEKERAKIAKPSFDLSDAFAGWWKATRKELANWNMDEFYNVASSIGGIRRENDRVFIRGWCKLNIEAADPQKMLESQAAQSLIRTRENRIRPNKSRLKHLEYLKLWAPPEQAYFDAMLDDPDALCFGLTYRARIGGTFIRDIVGSLER